MSPLPAPLTSTAELRKAGRDISVPFDIALDYGRTLRVKRLLRTLPGKRIVGDCELNRRRVLAKLFIARRGSERHWEQEHKGIALLAAHHIPTPALLAAGKLNDGHFLLTEFLDDAESLDDIWQAASLKAGPDLAAALPALSPALAALGRMHAAGLTQADLHLGNFLRQDDTLFVIDGDAIRAHKPGMALGGKEAMQNLAVLIAQLPAAVDTHIDTLLDAYGSGNKGIAPDRELLEAEIRRVRGWRLRDYLAKSLRDCTLFKVESRRDRFVAAVRSEADALAPILDNPDQWMSDGALLKDGGTSTVVLIDIDGRKLVIKRYNIKSAGHALSRFWRPTRAWHSWIEGHRLDFLGIATPRPLALIERRFGPLRGRAWLITEHCAGPDLKSHLAQYEDTGAPAAEQTALTRLFHQLKHERLTHGDLKATNLLWENGRLKLIDLDAMRQHQRNSTFAKAWRKDRARFLRNWRANSELHRWLCANFPDA